MIKRTFFKIKDRLCQFYIIMPLIMLLGIGLIFIPFGFNQIALFEEWDFTYVFKQNGPLYFITKGAMNSQFRLRPLNFLPPSLAHQLDSVSFFYIELFQFIFIWLKGVTLGSIIWWLYPNRWIAIFGGLLFMLYPADSQQIPIRIVSINCSVAFVLSSIAIFLWGTRATKLWLKLIYSILSSSLFLIGCFVYEAALFLAPMPFLLWWVKNGPHQGYKTLKPQLPLIFFWFSAIAIELAYLFWVGSDNHLYHSNISNNPLDTLLRIGSNASRLLTIVLYRTLLHGWYDAAAMLLAGGEWISYLPLAISLILLFFFFMKTKTAGSTQGTTKKDPFFITRWVFSSLLLIILGYFPFLTSYHHVFTSQRTYLYAQVGGALMITAFILVLQKKFRLISAGMASCILLLSVAAQWTQFSHYNNIGNQQKMILSGILREIPRVKPDETLLIIDRSCKMENLWLLGFHSGLSRFNLAISHLYGQLTRAVLCVDPNSWRCTEQEDSYTINQPGLPQYSNLSKKNLLVVIIEPDGSIHRDKNTPAQSPATSNEKTRWIKIMGSFPIKNNFTDLEKNPFPDHFIPDFGKWWDFAPIIPGIGWQPADASQWKLPAWKPRSISWIIQPKANLVFQLSPQQKKYIFQLKLGKLSNLSAKQSLKILLNGNLLSHNWLDPMHLQATDIDPAWLKNGTNELVFLTDSPPTSAILCVECIKLRPQKKQEDSRSKILASQSSFDFTSNGWVGYEKVSGFSSPENHGTWTDGKVASLHFNKIKTTNEKPQKVLISAKGFVVKNHTQNVIFTINGSKPIEYLFDTGERKIIELPIPQDDKEGIEINISLPNSISPEELKINSDPRKLGIVINSIKIE